MKDDNKMIQNTVKELIQYYSDLHNIEQFVHYNYFKDELLEENVKYVEELAKEKYEWTLSYWKNKIGISK